MNYISEWKTEKNTEDYMYINLLIVMNGVIWLVFTLPAVIEFIWR